MKSIVNSDSAQATLDIPGATRYWPRNRPPRRDQVLALAKSAINWPVVENMVRPHYDADAERTGRPGFSLGMHLRILAVQLFWRTSDRNLEAALADSKSLARFIGTDPWAPSPPSAAAIRKFRTLLTNTLSDSGVFSLLHDVVALMKSDIARAGFEFRPGVIDEPIFRRALSPLVGGGARPGVDDGHQEQPK